MDTTEIIISALASGATSGFMETAGKTLIKEAYQRLSNLVKNKLQKDLKAVTVLDEFAKDPKTWKKPLEKSIRDLGLTKDKEILLAAQTLLKLVQSQQPYPKYEVKIRGNIQGLVQGDSNTVTMNFQESSQKSKKPKQSRK